MANIKNKRVESNIQVALAKIISRELKNSNVGFTTITSVELTNDYSFATIYINVIGNTEKTIKALKSSTGFIKSCLAKEVQIRKIPNLIWKYDHSLEAGTKIEKILKNLNDKKDEG